MEELLRRAVELGASEAVVLDTKMIAVSDWVRLKCQFGCGNWGKNLTCPPYTPTPKLTRRVLSEYSKSLLIRKRGPWEDSHRVMIDLERYAFTKGYYKAFAFNSGPCRLCKECDVEGGCHHPSEARPSPEACGIDVFATASAAGLPISVVASRDEEPDYYGLLIVE